MKFASSKSDLPDASKTSGNIPEDTTKSSDSRKTEKKLIFFKDYFGKQRHNRSIFVEFLILIVACAITPIIVSNSIDYENSQSVLEKNTLTNLELKVDHNADKINSTINFLKSEMLSADYYYNIKLNFPILEKFDNDKNNLAYIQAKQTLDSQLTELTHFNNLINN